VSIRKYTKALGVNKTAVAITPAELAPDAKGPSANCGTSAKTIAARIEEIAEIWTRLKRVLARME
jgi:hypothetical protein